MHEHRTFWFDLCHPPHVAFFAPQIKRLQEMGHAVLITVRDRFQVAELCDLSGLTYVKIGKDYGRAKWRKAMGIALRTCQLADYMRGRNVDLAVSQGSTYQVLAAKLLSIPSTFMTDYEHIYLGIAKRLADWLVFPEIIPEDVLRKKHISPGKIIRYPGLKENVYLGHFRPQGDFLKNIGVDPGNIIITIRPPAVDAHYHNPVSEELLRLIFRRMKSEPGVTVIYLPRSAASTGPLMDSGMHVVIPEKTLKGLDLIYHSDMIISGGGTMNREAAAMGVPVYSIFKGPVPAVDRYLEQTGRLHFIDSEEDIKRIRIQKRKPEMNLLNPDIDLARFLVSRLLDMAGDSR